MCTVHKYVQMQAHFIHNSLVCFPLYVLVCMHTRTHTHRQSYDVTVELDVPGSSIKSHSTYYLKNPNFRYMTTPLSVPGTLHAPPTDTYFPDIPTGAPVGGVSSTQASVPPQSSVAPQTSQQPLNLQQQQQQLLVSANSTGVGAGLYAVNSLPNSSGTAVPPQMQNSTPQLQQLPPQQQPIPGVAPYSPSPSTAQSLNPAAPHFFPLSSIGGHHMGNGLLSTPSSGGFHQSAAMYVMGSQQMIYSQGRLNDVVSGGGVGAPYKFQGVGGVAQTKQQQQGIPPHSHHGNTNSGKQQFPSPRAYY